jgi:hypothetical protein
MTIVCMGCRQAPWERVWTSSVALLFSQDGGDVVSVLAAPRKREGRREEPSMVMTVVVVVAVIEVKKGGSYRAMDGPRAEWA